MNTDGYIYIFINPSMEGLIKVGKTTREPKERAEELSKATGVPTPFIVAYEMYVDDCTKAEEFVHTFLESKGYRVSNNREFFNAPLTDAINGLLEYKKTFDNIMIDKTIADVKQESKIKPWESVEKQANQYWLGLGDTLEDHKEALKLFKQAAKLGSPKANQQVGFMYVVGQGCNVDKELALEYFKKAINQGYFSCYADMMEIYFDIGNIDNALKCWDMYITKADYIDPYKCAVYISTMYQLKIPLKHVEKMTSIKDKIINEQREKIQRIKTKREQQQGNPNGFIGFYSDELYVLKYMQYLFSTDLNKPYMSYDEHLEKEKIRQQQNEFMFFFIIFISFFIALVVSYHIFSGFFIVTISTVVVGIAIMYGLCCLYDKHKNNQDTGAT